MTIATDELQKLLDAASPGPWRIGAKFQSVVADTETGHDDGDTLDAYGGHLVCESVKMDANAHLIALAPDLAAEVIRLRARDEAARKLAEAATPYASIVQNGDYARQLRQHDALVAALSAWEAALTPTFRMDVASPSVPARVHGEDPDAMWVIMPMRV